MKLQIMLVFLPYLLPKEFIMIDILLVEDDKEICFIFTELLKRNHYNVSAYHNGIEAIEALSSKKYDLMLLDLMLPDLPGEKILFHLKNTTILFQLLLYLPKISLRLV